MKTAREIALEKEVMELRSKVISLQNQLDAVVKIMLGAKSEKRTSTSLLDDQLSLFGDAVAKIKEEEAARETEDSDSSKSKQTGKQGKRKEKPVRKPFPESIRRQVEEIYPDPIPEGSKCIGSEVTEVLEIKAAEIYVRQIVRYKYALPQEEGVVIGKMPLLPIHKGNAGASILAYLIISKYLDHLPWYRLIKIFERQGIILSDSTINNWFRAVSDLLRPLYDRMVAIAMASKYLQVDESTIPVLDPQVKGKTHTGYFWVYHSPPDKTVIFDYQKGRAAKFPKEKLKDKTAWIQTDAYDAYNFITNQKGLEHVGCMAHARRKFFDAQKNDKKRANSMLDLIGELYGIEKYARDNNFSHEQRHALRTEKAKPVLKQIKEWLDENINQVTPDSKIGKATRYMLGIWDKLVRYTDDGMLEIDNNLAENKIRLLALGRKNYLFSGNHHAAQNAAMMYSFLGTCKANNINPNHWLPYAIEKLPYCKTESDYIELLPQNFEGV